MGGNDPVGIIQLGIRQVGNPVLEEESRADV